MRMFEFQNFERRFEVSALIPVSDCSVSPRHPPATSLAVNARTWPRAGGPRWPPPPSAPPVFPGVHLPVCGEDQVRAAHSPGQADCRSGASHHGLPARSSPGAAVRAPHCAPVAGGTEKWSLTPGPWDLPAELSLWVATRTSQTPREQPGEDGRWAGIWSSRAVWVVVPGSAAPQARVGGLGRSHTEHGSVSQGLRWGVWIWLFKDFILF